MRQIGGVSCLCAKAPMVAVGRLTDIRFPMAIDNAQSLDGFMLSDLPEPGALAN